MASADLPEESTAQRGAKIISRARNLSAKSHSEAFHQSNENFRKHQFALGLAK
jgi:hypothetical protein